MKRREYRRYKHGETFNLRWFVHLVRSLEKNKKERKKKRAGRQDRVSCPSLARD